MASLSRDLRRELERTVIKARHIGEGGARSALESLAVGNEKPWPTMSDAQKNLRVRLRAHGRQLGDREGAKRDTQTVEHLVQECAYEQWHRMLFARFLAENNLLIEPESKVPISLEECRELAMERGTDWLALASDFAIRMLPQIFRKGDPVLEVTLPPETRHELEALLKALPDEVFTAEDSLGWVYQYWQAERKNEVNDSGDEIGADELPAVTQLFTEDYMVLFLLHNTLGAWWKAKRKAEGKDSALRGYEWTYLRLKEDGTPAAGSFDGWPRVARDLKVLDPCMGSGHFLVFALPILVAFRMEEEGLSRENAVDAVLQENLFGLELDNRCTQIAAFNLALTAWRMAGSFRDLPRLNLACSGLGINAKEEDWLRLAGSNERARETMRGLYDAFKQAPLLGSLIDPRRVGGTLFTTEFQQVRPLLLSALAAENRDEATSELAVAASGIVRAADILVDTFTLVATNVPFVGRGKQDDDLSQYCESHHQLAQSDLGTCLLERGVSFLTAKGTIAIVIPQKLLSQDPTKSLRQHLLRTMEWNAVAIIGARGFQSPMWDLSIVLVSLTRSLAATQHEFLGIDVATEPGPEEKARSLIERQLHLVNQQAQLSNPQARISVTGATGGARLNAVAGYANGIQTGDLPRFTLAFWELPELSSRWSVFRTTVTDTIEYGGMSQVLLWENGNGRLIEFIRERLGGEVGAWVRGKDAWGKTGVLVSAMGKLPVSIYKGELFDNNTVAIIPRDTVHQAAVWAACSDSKYAKEVRKISNALKVYGPLVEIPFDLGGWETIVKRAYPNGLPRPYSSNPTQWIFVGRPKGSAEPLAVAVARLLGYRWPRQSGSTFADCPAVGPDGLEKHTNPDGIVCLNPVKGEMPASDRLRALLAETYGSEWSASKQSELLSQVGYAGKNLEEWLRDGFFEYHCDLFHQRPFVWHVWDGLRDGFHALVNCHKLAAPNGEGRQTLEKLIYTYLGDWIDRQRADQKSNVEGADARVAAAMHLQSELKKILEGEPPYDIFVRWKPVHEEPIGWEPDINDGVRINIRPFMMAKVLNGRGKSTCILRTTPKIKWDKDRGMEPHRTKEDFPWFWSWDESTADFAGGREFDGYRWNDLHYTRKSKQAARDRYAVNKKRQKG